MSFGTLALIVAVGLLGPLLAAVPRYGPPLVVGEILAGLAVGDSGLRLIDTSDRALDLLSQVGFALLMLIVGTHLPIRQPALRPALARALLAAGATGVLALALGFALAPVTGLRQPLVLAVLLATSSAAVALPVIQTLGEAPAPDAATALLVTTAWIAAADVTTVLAIPLVLREGSIASVLLGILGVAVATAVVYVGARRLGRSAYSRQVRKASKKRHWALDLRVSLAVLFVLAWLATRQHTSVLVAGFAAGLLLALLGEPRRLAQQLIGLGEGFLVPLFFVVLGARIDLGALVAEPRNLVLAGALAAGSVVVHVAVALALRLPVGSGLLATAQLGVPAAVASIGLATGRLLPGQAAAVLAAALISLVACSVGAARLGHRASIGDHTAPAEVPGNAPAPG